MIQILLQNVRYELNEARIGVHELMDRREILEIVAGYLDLDRQRLEDLVVVDLAGGDILVRLADAGEAEAPCACGAYPLFRGCITKPS